MRFSLMLLALVWPSPVPAPALDGLCGVATDPLGVLTCRTPGGPVGQDSEPPQIKTKTDYYKWKEPIWQWQDRCPRKDIARCWEGKITMEFGFESADPSRIIELGINVEVEYGDGGRKELHQLRGQALFLTGTGTEMTPHHASAEMNVYPMASRSFQLRVTHLCSKDTLGNSICVPQ